jgi:hypothetical protein
MDRARLVLGAHGVVAVGLIAFGAYRISRGSVVPGALNVVMAAAVVAVGVYMSRHA